MKLIPLTNNQHAVVDEEDYDKIISICPWNAHWNKGTQTYYAHGVVKKEGKRVSMVMARVIMNCPEGLKVDHKSGDTLDNRKINLRICTHSQNGANRKPRKDGTSKYLGVHLRKETGRWRAAIRINKKAIKLGHFSTQEEAALCYNKAAIIYHGEFARLNVIE